MLIRVITAYLATHKRLVIPQLGAFLVKEPNREVVFSELIRRDDGVLRSLLEAEGVASVAAAGEIDRLVFEVRHAIKESGEYRMEGLGRLCAGANATIAFVYEPTVTTAPTVEPEPMPVAEVSVEQPIEQPVAELMPEESFEEAIFEEHEVEVSHETRELPEEDAPELHLSVSPKMHPASHVKGLKYGKPPKNTNAFTYVDKPRRSGGDRFIWFAVVAILLALGAIAFGFYHEWSEQAAGYETPAVEMQPTDSLTSDLL